jgi:hypothetical protein
MEPISYSRHRFPPAIIQLYFRFSLSYRDVEDLLAERGIDVSYKTIRRWAVKICHNQVFPTYFLRNIRQCQTLSCQTAVQPPSIINADPVTNADASDAR